MIRENWIKPRATVLEVGIHRLAPEPRREKGRSSATSHTRKRWVGGRDDPFPAE
jgi:hypothetical protein